MTVHFLKVHPGPFRAVRAGLKTFEYRLNDRDFAVGDTLVLQEFDPFNSGTEGFTGEESRQLVTYLLEGGRFGVPANYVVMAIKEAP